ncbi:MAG TPA: GNAT family N-acetyltransferase [Mycobacteriales bacterium]|nr:GNAT family N-acetyltransferase [Mycobacteriales bacterium]
MSPSDLWRKQLALESKEFTARGTLVEVPGPDPDELATCYLATYPGGSAELVFADDAPESFITQVRGIDIDRLHARPAEVARDLDASLMHCCTYVFDEPIAIPSPATIRQTGPESFSAVVDGKPVAEAVSSRSDAAAAELWVHTDPEHRRRGYAAQVAAAWAAAVTSTGKTAFYSHLAGNDASRSLAAHLGVRPLFELVGLSIPGSMDRTDR